MSSSKKGSIVLGVLVAADKTLAYNEQKEDEVSTDIYGRYLLLLSSILISFTLSLVLTHIIHISVDILVLTKD